MPPRPGRLVAGFAAGAALAVAALAAESPKIAALGEKWTWVSDARFEVLTNGPERRARDVIEELEAFRATLARLNGGAIDEPGEPVRILQFDRVWDMTAYQTRDASGKPDEWAGYFISDGSTRWIALTNEDRDEIPRLVLSSYSYSLIARQIGVLPLWMRTGLAEYFSAFHHLEREHRAEIGKPIGDHVRYLNQSTHFPLASLLAMTYDSPEFARDVPRYLFYAKSWLLVHYLQLGAPQRAGTLGRYAQLRAQGMADPAALEQAAGCSLATLEDELAVYQKKSLMPYQTVDLPPSAGESTIVARSATREDAVYRLGEYLLALGGSRREEALAHFAAVGRPEPARTIEAIPISPAVARAEAQPAPAAAPGASPAPPVGGARPRPVPIPQPTPEEAQALLDRDAEMAARYAAALDLVNAQKIEAGAEALRQFLRDYPDSRFAAGAQATLKQVEAFLARKKARQSPP